MPLPVALRVISVITLATLATPLTRGFEASSKPAPSEAAPPLTKALLKGLEARSIGPAVMGGRIADIAIDPENPWIFYLAQGHGGLLKTTNNGATFSGMLDDEDVESIGAVAVAPSDGDVVWVGTGEANDRNSSGWGNGVYRTTDGGETWTHAGLEKTKTIARVVVHPTDPKTAYVAAMGDLWSDNPDRGCYKTIDGGKTWQAVLTAKAPWNVSVGCGDIAVDPSAPETVYAALYARQRKPWSFTAGPRVTGGEDVGGIFKSVDGGSTWKKLGEGLPEQTGRIGLAIYVKNPKILYALVESFEGGTTSIDEVRSKQGGVFRSENGGETWTRMSPLNPRPFYFSQIRVDPTDAQRIYVLAFALHVSEDGGRTFREDRFGNVHPDNHALAFDPDDPQRMLLGTDGGVYQTFDGGEHWSHVTTFPMGEFYQVSVDMSRPYRICGGLQDNVNWLGPSMTRSKEGITNADWMNIYGGDGFYCVFDAEDPDIVYAESQQGSVHRLHVESGATKMLRPEPAEGAVAFRFHWNAPFIGSQHQKDTMYLGGNRVFKLSAQGERWRVISPDLSFADPAKILATGSGAENYAVVYALAESPVKADLLWAGTDDGRLWVTDDEGAEWTERTEQLPKEVQGLWISRIEPGHHDPKVAYLTALGYPFGRYEPFAYRTADGGATWQSVAGNLPENAPVRVIREDPFNPNLLFAGTELGLYASLDGGASWLKWPGLPTVRVDDILVHPRERDLVIATHGRSLFIVDDLRPLEELTEDVRAKAAHLFSVRPAIGFEPLEGWEGWSGKAIFRGKNPELGALITVWIKEYTGEPVEILVESKSGVPVAELEAPGTPGFSRVAWDLKLTKDLKTEYGGEGDAFVRPGEYVVTMKYGDVSEEQDLKVEIMEGLETR